MKKFFKWAGIVVGAIVLIVLCVVGYINWFYDPTFDVKIPDIKVQATTARLERGKELVLTLCSECHKDPVTKQLTGRRIGDLPEQFGTAYSRNITSDPVHGIGSWKDGEIIWLLRTGIHPKTHKYVPPWMVKLHAASDEDIYSIVSFLRSDDPVVAPSSVENKVSQAAFFAKFLMFIGAFKPFDYPAAPVPQPDTTNKVEYGRYMANHVFECYGCHSADFATDDFLHPEKSVDYYGGGNEMPNYDKINMPTRNITPDNEHGIGKWTEEQFVTALKTGFRPDGTLLRNPMIRFTHVSDYEISCIYQFLRTVPPLKKPNKPTPVFPAPANATTGEKLYINYGCINCHSATGSGYADLQLGYKKYPDDSTLIGFIKHPEKYYPGTVMPVWDGHIPDNELKEIAMHVRMLGQKAGR